MLLCDQETQKTTLLSFVKNKIDCLKSNSEQSMKFKTSYNLLHCHTLCKQPIILTNLSFLKPFPSSHLCMFLSLIKTSSLFITLTSYISPSSRQCYFCASMLTGKSSSHLQNHPTGIKNISSLYSRSCATLLN